MRLLETTGLIDIHPFSRDAVCADSTESIIILISAMGSLSGQQNANLLLLQNLLSCQPGTSPFTLLQDTLNQSARPVIEDYIRHATVRRLANDENSSSHFFAWSPCPVFFSVTRYYSPVCFIFYPCESCEYTTLLIFNSCIKENIFSHRMNPGALRCWFNSNFFFSDL